MISKHFSNLVHSTHTYLPMKLEQTECSETPGNYPEESIKHPEHGESLKSGNITVPEFYVPSD